MLQPAGSYSMTDVRCRGGRSRENRKATTRFGARPLPVRRPDRVSGKKIMEGHVIDVGQPRQLAAPFDASGRV